MLQRLRMLKLYWIVRRCPTLSMCW